MLLLAASSATWLPGPALAEPTVWQRAARPALARMARALELADRRLGEHIGRRTSPGPLTRAPRLEQALRALEAVGGRHARNAWVRLHVGQLEQALYAYDHDRAHLERAATELELAGRSRLPALVRADALGDLAICYARLGDHRHEIEAYDGALALEPHPESRAVLLANRAEGQMAQGDAMRAVAGYRASLRLTPSAAMAAGGVSTLWGLAVALDRSGDLDQALEEVGRARRFDPYDEAIHGSHWFYVPAYDERWYQALGHWARARSAKDKAARLTAYRQAVRAWRRFIEQAAPTDPWLRLASARLHQCEDELGRAVGTPPRRR